MRCFDKTTFSPSGKLTQAVDGGPSSKGAGRRIDEVCASVEHSITHVETQIAGQSWKVTTEMDRSV